MRSVGRATVASAVIFALAITGWILQRPTEPEPSQSIPWPDVSWVIVTTTSTTTTTAAPKPEKPTPVITVAPEATNAPTSVSVGELTTVPEIQTTVAAEPSLEASTTTVASIN